VSIRVLLADNDVLMLEGIGMILGAEPDIEIVAQVGDGAAAVVEARRHRPDVALVDVRMPVMDGVEATRLITADDLVAETGRTVAVLAISGFRIDENVHACLRAGASGFVLKDAAGSELVAAIRAVADGEAWLDPGVARRVIERSLHRPDDLLPPAAAASGLTAREREVLTCMAHGMSNTAIAEHHYVVIGTVKTHIRRIFMKLGVRDRAQAVAFAYRSGLVRPDDPPPSPRR
jgi:DNA-binding NarL/FixJ family response regulator